MIKRFHEILLKDVILLDETKSARSLKKFIFFPTVLLKKRLEKLVTKIFDSIGGNTIDTIQDDFDKLLSYRKIQLLEVLNKAINIEIGSKAKISAWFNLIIDKDCKESPQLEKIIEEIKTHTGIDIKTGENIKEFQDYFQYKIDKYTEMYPVLEKEKVSIIDTFNSVFIYLGQPINIDLSLISFLSMKKMAEEKIKQERFENKGDDQQ